MESPLLYKKMTGFAKTDGQRYEVNLAAMLYLRGLNSGLDFQLATNVLGAGALDDIVFRFKPSGESATWTTLFVQLKHKANRPVQRATLISQKGDFSLPKYFRSYLEIKQAMSAADEGCLFDGDFEKSVFVIFTNAKASESIGKECRETLSEAEKFVWCGLGNVFSFEEDEDILKCLGECGDEGKAYLGRLKLFCSQPNANRIKEVIKKELRGVDDKIVQGVDIQRLRNRFLRRLKVWWSSSSEVLHSGNDLLRLSVLEIMSQNTEKQFVLDIGFAKAVRDTLRVSMTDGCQVVNVQASESSCRLSLTKLCQVCTGSFVLDCEGLLAKQGALIAQRRKVDEKSLIICTNDWSTSLQAEYFKVVKDLLAIRDTPPIVFLSNGDNCALRAIANEFRKSVKSFEDKFLFSQLKKATQRKVLEKKVSLQGHSTTLHELLHDNRGGADRVLDACSVVEVLDCGNSLTLGTAFDECISYYVSRHLEKTTVVKTSLFQDGTLRETVTIRVMECTVPADLGLGDRRSSRSPQVSATNNRTGLFDKAVRFLSSINGFMAFCNGQTASDLSNSLLVADEVDPEVFIGPTFALGSFECNSVGLRFGQQDAVTTLRVRSSKHSTLAGFLFVSDKTSENDVKELSDFHQSKHLLSLEDGQLRWIRSQGDIEWIRQHIDKDQVSTFSPENAMDVEDRLVLVCAEPGMGKSTLMARLAKKTKEAYPHFFVLSMALNDHFSLFVQKNHLDVLGFLCSANKIESHLHRSLLKFALEVSGDVVVLFDGYDEIAPKYVKESCDLLERLVEGTKASKVWMTSRNSIRTTLEARISKIAVKLRKFNEEDQISFLQMFWATISRLGASELDALIRLLVEKASRAVRDKEIDLMGIPLQTRMLAEVYEGHVTGTAGKSDLPDKLDLLVLLEQFVDKKCRVHVEAKLNTPPDSPIYEEQLKSLRKNYNKSHSNAGLVLILGDDITNIQCMKPVIKKSLKFFEKIQCGDEKSGFIDSVVNDRPRFIHRVFAEYFVAKWFSKHFADHQELVESKIFTFDFAVVRIIFDKILARGCVLHTAVINEDIEEVRTLLEREDLDVNAKDGGGRTPLHLAASLGNRCDREDNKKRGEMLDLLIGKTSDFHQVDDVLGVSPLRYADVTRSYIAIDRFNPCTGNKEQFPLVLENVSLHAMLDAIFNFDLYNLLRFCLENGLEVTRSIDENEHTPLHLAGKLKSPNAVRVLLEALDEADRAEAVNLTDNDGNSVLMCGVLGGCVECVRLVVTAGGKMAQVNDEGLTPLMAAAEEGHLKVVSYLLSNFNAEREGMTQQSYINMTEKKGFSAIHIASWKGHSNVIGCLIGKGGVTPSPGIKNSTPLHLAAKLKHPAAVRVLLEALEGADRADAVNSLDNFGNTVLICGAWGGCLECVALIVNAGGNLTQVNDKGLTPLMAAAEEGHQEVVSYLLDNFNAERERTSQHDYISMVDKIGFSAIHVAAWKGYSQVISCLLGRGDDPQCRTHHNSTPLHLAAKLKHPDAVRVLLEALDEADRADAVNTRNNYGNSALMCGAFGGCAECVELLVKAGGKVTQVHETGLTPLMTAAQEGHQEVVSYLLNNFNAEKERMSRIDYINMTHNMGWAAIHFAAWKGHSHVITYIIGQGGDPLVRTHCNSTPLHLTTENKHPEALCVLLEALDKAGRADTVNLQDNQGDSVLTCAALAGCANCVALVVKAGGKLIQVNDDGRTPLMVAAQEGHQEVVSYLLNSFNAEKEGVSRHGYINMAEKVGWTAIHFAAGGGHSRVISSLLCHGSDPKRRDNFNSTPLHVAGLSKHPDALRVLLEALDEADRAGVVNSLDNDGNSVLMCAAWGGCVECVGLVIKAGGKLTQVNSDGLTPLIAAVLKRNSPVVEHLLSEFDPVREGMTKLAYINMTEKEGNTALDLARSECRRNLQGYLQGLVALIQCMRGDGDPT